MEPRYFYRATLFFLFLRKQHRSQNRQHQNTAYNHQGMQWIDMIERSDDHFDTNKRQDNRQSEFQFTEQMDEIRQQKVQSS